MFPRLALVFPFTTPIPTQNKRRMQSCISRQFHVAVTITNHPACREIDVEIRCGAIDQSGFWFAAVTVNPVWRLAYRRMMRAVVDRVELRARQILPEPLVNADDYVLGKITARNTRLVRDNNRKPVVIIQDPDRFRRVWKQLKARGMIDITNLFGNRSITI